jgi:hypothetical protein
MPPNHHSSGCLANYPVWGLPHIKNNHDDGGGDDERQHELLDHFACINLPVPITAL